MAHSGRNMYTEYDHSIGAYSKLGLEYSKLGLEYSKLGLEYS